MRIRALRTLCFAQPMIPIHAGSFAGALELVLTVVEADDGTEGYALARSHGGQSGRGIANQIEASLRPLVLGRDASDPQAVWESMAALEPAGYVSVFAISAVDVALWDLAGKLRRMPVAQLCGGRRTAMAAYASSSHHDTIDAYVADLHAALALGFTAYKVHPFYDAARDIALARALRDAAGPAFGGNGQLDNGVFISGNVNFVRTSQFGPQSGASAFNDYFSGGGGSIYARLFYLPRNVNLNEYPFEHPITGDNLFYRALDNPRWIAKYNQYTSDINRAYGSFSAGYDVTEWLNVLVKGGINTYTDLRRDVVRSGGSNEPLGHVWNDDLTNTEQDYNMLVTVQKDINQDLAFRGIVGYNMNQRDFRRNRVTGTGIISDGLNTGLYRLDGTVSQIATRDYTSQRRLNGAYTDLSLSFRDYLFLNIAARNDWSSTLPKDNNNYFYPSASVSFVLSEALTMPGFMNYAKVRVAASKVGNDADPYLTSTNYQIGVPFTTSGGTKVNRASLANTLGNPALKPEFTTEYEAGAELKFLNNKVGLDVTYFQRTSTDQILRAALPRSTGFTEQVVNFGELENKGWEVGLNITPVQLSNGFTWDTYFAFTRIKSLVVDAGPTGEVIIGGPGTSLATIHRNGFPYGQIFGTVNAKTDDGQLLIDKETGLPFGTGQSEIIGDPNPDFTLGINNTFSWKGITLSALIDWKQGGDF